VRRRVEAACATAIRQATLPPMPEPDDRLYRVTSRDQAMQRASEMLARAERFVIVNATPGPADAIGAWLKDTASRGVRVAMKSFAGTGIPGVDVRLDPRGEKALRSAPGEWLIMTADGRDILAALFEHANGQLHAGYWTQNPLLAWTLFSGMSADFVLADVRGALALGESAEQIQARLSGLAVYEAPDSEGKLAIISAYRRPTPARQRRDAGRTERGEEK
jgi:hypothetical protein